MKLFAYSSLLPLVAVLLGYGGSSNFATAAAINCADDSEIKVTPAKTTTTAANSKTEDISTSITTAINPDGDNGGGDVDDNSDILPDSSSPSKPAGSSQVTHFLQTVQDTLEKAKPWVEEIEKEAKKLEETAKRFGESVLHGLGDFVERLIGSNAGGGGGGVAGGISVAGDHNVDAADNDTSTSSSSTTDSNTNDSTTTAASQAATPGVDSASDAENEITAEAYVAPQQQ